MPASQLSTPIIPTSEFWGRRHIDVGDATSLADALCATAVVLPGQEQRIERARCATALVHRDISSPDDLGPFLGLVGD